jgi:arylsulfatase
VPGRFGNETFDVGMDNGSPVSEAYEPPFAYVGIIKKVTISLQPSALGASDHQAVSDMERAAALTIE